MVRYFFLSVSFCLLFLGSCQQHDARFDAYKQKFKEFKLPLVIKGCYLSDSNFIEVSPRQDTPVIIDRILAYCSVPANGNYYATITLAPADCYVPVLTTFNKEGNKIDEKAINIGGCGADCGFTCEEYMIINKDYSIYVSDTISQTKCDSMGNEIPGTTEHYVNYKTGKLLSNGKIKLSEEKKKVL